MLTATAQTMRLGECDFDTDGRREQMADELDDGRLSGDGPPTSQRRLECWVSGDLRYAKGSGDLRRIIWDLLCDLRRVDW
nr:hypothetical protein Iba_scaffold2853CG0140 [Ipomoea batatas]